MLNITIRKILIFGIIFLALIWGGIFGMVLADPSYKLIIPSIPAPLWLQKTPDLKVDLSVDGPWKQDLFMGSGNLSNFGGKSFLVHGTATPSAIYKNSDVVVYFNYYPKDNRKVYGKIYWIKSSDQGRAWSQPTPVTIIGLPELTTSPISPKAILMPNGKIKLYFLAKKQADTRNKLFAAISSDGVNFTFDPTTSFEIEDESLISFSMTILNDRMHLFAATEEGSSTGTAYNAISYDTKVFTRLADVKIDQSFYGQTSLLTEGDQLKLIGSSDRGLWISSSSNGNNWSSPTYLNFYSQNPTAVFVGDKYLLFYTAVASSLPL